jgi:hypothetical protein
LKKTKIICFNKNGFIPKKIFYFGNQIVEKTSYYKYLGTIITNTGSFKMNEVNLKKKGLRAAYLVSKISLQAKPSSSIKIFEKVVEPILMYNFEVSLAYITKSWTYEKFKNEMWDVGSEVNKVILSFLRQTLGVHKKTSNLAIFGETGKYPISVKIFVHILKYWYRLKYSENHLLKASKDANIAQDQRGMQNWHKMVRFLLKITDLDNIADHSEKEAQKIVASFKQKIKNMYNQWWFDKMASVDNRKLKFLFEYKKTFKFEKYLDIIPRNTRIYTTRLRTSSHAYPIETLRYCKPKVEPQDRKCKICPCDRTGDENHYLFDCSNDRLRPIRDNFIQIITQIVPTFKDFNQEHIIQYCLLLHDIRTIARTANYIKEIHIAFKEETEEKKKQIPTVTRSGRTVKKPAKLDL